MFKKIPIETLPSPLWLEDNDAQEDKQEQHNDDADQDLCAAQSST